MNKKFTFLTAVLALLAFLAIPMGMRGQTRENYQGTFSRISNVSDFVTGYYVVTPSQSASTTNKALGNTVDSNKRIAGVNVTISNNNQIVNPVNTVVYYITVSTSGSTTTCTFQNVNTGKYMYQASTTSGKGMGFSNDASSITLAGYNGSSPIGFKFTLNGTSNNVFKWNNGSSWYANYSGAYSTSMTPVELYKLESTPSTDPVLSLDPTSIGFGSVAINPSSAYTETFEVSFENLTQNLTVSVGSGLTGVSVDPATILKTASSPATVTVSYNPTTAGNLSGIITVGNSDDQVSETVAVSGSAYDPATAPRYELYSGTITEGDYVIYYDGKAMKNTVTSNRLDYLSVTPSGNNIVNPDASIVWHIAPDGNYWTIYSAAVNEYAASTTAKNQATLVSSVTDNARWTVTGTETYDFENLARSTGSDSNNKWLRNNGTYGFACYASGTGGELSLYKLVNANQVAAPMFDPVAGTYNSAQNVTLTCATDGASIQYKLTENGTWQNYIAAIPVSETTTIWAQATKDDMEDSPVVSATYTISLPAVETPTFSPAGGNYYSAQNVTLTCATTGATIYYTTDGSDPTTSSSVYSSSIPVSATTTIKAIAAASGYTNSAVASATYTILEAVFNQDWEGETNGWTFVSVSGDQAWSVSSYSNNHYAKMSGFASNANHANVDWCISPVFDLGDYTNPVLTFTTARSSHNGEVLKVYFTNSYSGDPATTSWTELSCTLPEQPSSGFSQFVSSGDIDLSSFSGTNCYIGFKYTSTDQAATTWELDDIALTSVSNDPVINANDINLTYDATFGEISYTITNPVDGRNLTATSDDTWISNITVTSDKVTFNTTANSTSSARTATITLSYSGATDKVVTVTQAAYIPVPSGNPYIRITSLDQLTDGSIVVIASRYNSDATNYYAMKNTLSSGKTEGEEFISTTSNGIEVLPAAIVNDIDNYYWTVTVNNGNYTFTKANGDVIGWGSGASFVMNGDNTAWSVIRGTSPQALVEYYDGFVITNVNSTTRCFAFKGDAKQFGPYAWSNNTDNKYNFYLDFFVQTEPQTYTKTILPYSRAGYYLIASPIGTVNPTQVTNMITDPIENPEDPSGTLNTYDLYGFDQNEALEWRNYRKDHFNLEAGKGYLYAHRTGVDLIFTGFAISGSTYDVTLTKVENPGSGIDFPDWNLVGNPFAVVAYIDKPYYKMNTNGTQIIAVNGSSVEAKEGIFVKANTNNEVMTFSTTAPAPGKSVVLNLNDGNNLIDRAIVVFSESEQLPKFQLDRNSTKLYIPQDGQDYAVVCSEEMGETPVSFEAEENGTYTMSFSKENVEFGYLHLIDNLTGKDIDLLQTPSYSFEAKLTDYANRFKLVYATGDNSNDDTFAFYSNGSFVINNEGNAMLQVIDVTGRIIKSESINGSANVNVNAAPGVYMLRLVNGDNVKVQKVVVK